MEDTGVTKVGQVGHIFSAVKLGRVDLADLLLSEGLQLSTDLDSHLTSRLGRGQTLQVSSSLQTGNPHGFLGIVRLGLVGLLHLVGDCQPGRGVWLGALTLLDVAWHPHTLSSLPPTTLHLYTRPSLPSPDRSHGEFYL